MSCTFKYKGCALIYSLSLKCKKDNTVLIALAFCCKLQTIFLNSVCSWLTITVWYWAIAIFHGVLFVHHKKDALRKILKYSKSNNHTFSHLICHVHKYLECLLFNVQELVVGGGCWKTALTPPNWCSISHDCRLLWFHSPQGFSEENTAVGCSQASRWKPARNLKLRLSHTHRYYFSIWFHQRCCYQDWTWPALNPAMLIFEINDFRVN